jgi:hypothetical protein
VNAPGWWSLCMDAEFTALRYTYYVYEDSGLAYAGPPAASAAAPSEKEK